MPFDIFVYSFHWLIYSKAIVDKITCHAKVVLEGGEYFSNLPLPL